MRFTIWLFDLSWYHFEAVFFSAKSTELATEFLSIQSNGSNKYWGIGANLLSQPSSLTCTYFEGVIEISFKKELKRFPPVEWSLECTNASQLGFEVKVLYLQFHWEVCLFH